MNKTVTVNISGIIFYIEEEAFHALNRYLDALKLHLAKSQGKEEIIADVEGRMAELFSERLNDRKQVITQASVDEVIATLGQPQDYELEDEDEINTTQETEEEQLKATTKKRVFRNSDDKLIGGILGGLAAYFNHDPIWWRLAFVVFMFLGWGSPILLYLLLWVIIPEAKTRAEKLQMRGEDITVENLKRKVEAEAENIRQNLSNLQNGSSSDKLKSAIQEIVQFFINLFGIIFRVIGRLFGAFLILSAIGLSIALVIGLSSANSFSFENNGVVSSSSIFEMIDFMVDSPAHKSMILWGFGIFAVISLMGLLYSGLKLLFKINPPKIKGLAASLVVVNIVAVTIGFWGASNVAADFGTNGRVPEISKLDSLQSDTIKLDLFEDQYFTLYERPDNDGFDLIKIEENRFINGNVKLDVVKSRSGKFEVEVTRYAQGRSSQDAIRRAEKIEYQWVQKDSLLTFTPYYIFSKKDKFRMQEVEIRVKVPVGKSVYFNPDLSRILYDVKNVSHTWDSEMAGHTWTMTEEGLACPDFPKEEL